MHRSRSLDDASSGSEFKHRTPSQARIQVLVAEDTVDNQRLIELFLAHVPCHLTFVEDGVQAVEAFKAQRFSLILMDIQMPRLDGNQATEQIRRIEHELKLPPTPIVVLTAHTFPDDLNRSMAAGITAHLSKPLSRDALIQTVCRLGGLHSIATPGTAVVYVEPEIAPLIPSFLANRRRDIHRLKSMVEQQQFEGIRYLAHTLKGVGGSYGFELLSELGRQLELAASTQSLDGCMTTINTIGAYLETVRVTTRPH